MRAFACIQVTEGLSHEPMRQYATFHRPLLSIKISKLIFRHERHDKKNRLKPGVVLCLVVES